MCASAVGRSLNATLRMCRSAPSCAWVKLRRVAGRSAATGVDREPFTWPSMHRRGDRAVEFLAAIEQDDPQEAMARWTGNYRRGNKRTAKNHPRNARR
jgi:hypothetical protein